jgi:hypothetical protein
MPTTYEEQDSEQQRVGARPGLEGLGLGIAPRMRGDDRSERERAEIGAGHRRRGALVAGPADRPPLAPELVDEAVDRASARRRVGQALQVPSDRRIGDRAAVRSRTTTGRAIVPGSASDVEAAGDPRALTCASAGRSGVRVLSTQRTPRDSPSPAVRSLGHDRPRSRWRDITASPSRSIAIAPRPNELARERHGVRSPPFDGCGCSHE